MSETMKKFNAEAQKRKGAEIFSIFFATEITKKTENLTIFKKPFASPLFLCDLCNLCDLCGKKTKKISAPLRFCASALKSFALKQVPT